MTSDSHAASKVLFVAGEPSGDAQAARLAAALREIAPGVRMNGVGGARMRAAGVDTFIDISELSVMGIAEVASSLARLRRLYKRIVEEIRGTEPPSVVVLIDFPEFNLRVARAVRKAGIEVFWYVSPQIWAWRRGRIRKICRRVDRMVVLFPFEAELYAEKGLDARYFGNPLAEEVAADRDAAATRRRYDLPASKPLIVLLPGSRSGEVERILPAMLEAAGELSDRAVFALAIAGGLDRGGIEATVRASGVDVALVENDTYNLLACADAAAVTSGTATVEAAMLGCPMVVVYKMAPVSYWIARALVRVSHIAMPNIVLGERVVPELIQDAATGPGIAAELRRFLDEPGYREGTVARLRDLRTALVHSGAATRAARFLLEGLR